MAQTSGQSLPKILSKPRWKQASTASSPGRGPYCKVSSRLILMTITGRRLTTWVLVKTGSWVCSGTRMVGRRFWLRLQRFIRGSSKPSIEAFTECFARQIYRLQGLSGCPRGCARESLHVCGKGYQEVVLSKRDWLVSCY